MPSISSMETLASSGAEFGEYAGARTPVSFGSPSDELASLRSGAAVFDLSWQGKLVVTGEDRVRWMNGMVTGNVRDLNVQHGIFAFVLNPQGRIQADATIFNRGEYLLLTSELSQIPRIKEFFDGYIIMDDVEVTDVSEKLKSIGVAGPNASATLTEVGLLPRTLDPGEVIDSTLGGIGYSIARSPIEIKDGYELWFAAESFDPIWNALVSAGARPVGTTALEWMRILRGLPRVGIDIADRDLPQETGQTYALHYSKGCYIGQEIVERIHSRGNVNRLFAGFEIQGPLPEHGTKIMMEQKVMGEITTSATIPVAGSVHPVAIGYLRRELSAPGTEIKIGESTTAKVVALPFAF
jgi:folate-binding protein YgfZ